MIKGRSLPNCKLIHGDCLEVLKHIPSGSIDLVVTSPPYDNLRDYDGTLEWNFEIFQKIANELKRIIKKGGVIVWVVGDATVKGSETGSSFKQALYFKEIGLNLHDTMIYQKNSYPFPPSNRYYQQIEYMFVISNGAPKTFNGLRVPTIYRKNTSEISTTRQKDGTTKAMKYEKGKVDRLMDNIWPLNTGFMRTTKDKEAYKHPALFPDELAKRHILSWSNEGDMVLDPFMGSGTTGKQSKILNRKFIGIEKDKNYFDISYNRIKNHVSEIKGLKIA